MRIPNAVDAAERGAVIRTRTRCIRAERGAAWRLVLDVRGRRDLASARVLINATGPWIKLFASSVLQGLYYVEGRHRWGVEPLLLVVAGGAASAVRTKRP